MVIETAPPVAHAVGGSLGSALALLLLFPLERARIELQTMNANSDYDSFTALQQQSATRGGSVLSEQVPATPASVSEESWASCPQRPESPGEISSSSSSSIQTIRKQKVDLWKCIYQLHQRNQLYRGVAPVVTTMAVSNFVFFYAHAFLKQWLSKLMQNTLRLSLMASTLAGICNVLLTNPLWVANLRIVTSGREDSSHQSLWKEMKHIVETEGWAHLWNGTYASLLLVSNPIIQFVSYEQIKNRLLHTLRQQQQQHPQSSSTAASLTLKPMEAFLLGALAKAISTVLTYPLQLAQTVLRVQKQEQQLQRQSHAIFHAQPLTPRREFFHGKSETAANEMTLALPTTDLQVLPTQQQHPHHPYHGTLDCLIKIYRTKGIEGWFAGIQTKLLQTVLTAAFTFLSYEQIIRAIMAVHRTLQENRSSRPTAGTPVP